MLYRFLSPRGEAFVLSERRREKSGLISSVHSSTNLRASTPNLPPLSDSAPPPDLGCPKIGLMTFVPNYRSI